IRQQEMNENEKKKWEEMIALTTDHETAEMLRQLDYNWEVAASRMEQIVRERQEGLYDDSGVDAMAVFSRMERVGTLLFALKDRPQALLLKGFRRQLEKMNGDHRMDAEVAAMISPLSGKGIKIDTPTIWKRIQDIYETMGARGRSNGAVVRKLFKDRYLPHMDDDESMGWMAEFVKPSAEDDEKQAAQREAIEEMAYLGENIGKVASNSKQQIALGLMLMQQTVVLLGELFDFHSLTDESVDAIFEDAKHELMEGEAWRQYWRSHLAHFSLMGGSQLSDQLKADAEEVERQLLGLHGYLYNKWDESAEAFGRALKESDLSDEELLHLLFLLAKKEMLEGEGDLPDSRLATMRRTVTNQAEKLDTLCSDKYIDHYEAIWEDIVQNPILAGQLSTFRNGKHNLGFNMQCFCHIVGWLMRERQFFDTDSPAELGKKLGDNYSKETFRDYIKKTRTVLTAQSISELDAILKRYEKH
ncbi:MAG: hypothetical protein IJ868_01115, partial [Prevotella sp.]|nr:hypothetical protein [Prevotella sp.]